MDPNPILLCPHQKQKFGHRETHTGRTPCEDGSRVWGDASTSQGRLKISRKPPEARREAGTDSPSQPSEGTNPANTLILYF